MKNVRLHSFEIIKLFGLYNHAVELNSDRVTVIHGPNGVGKTVILKLVNSFFLGFYGEIARIPFERFTLTFTEGFSVSISRDESSISTLKLNVKLLQNETELDSGSMNGDDIDFKRMADRIAATSPFIMELGNYEWIDHRTDEVFTAEQLVLRNQEFHLRDKRKVAPKEPKKLKELRARFANIHLIEAQRLIRFGASVGWDGRSDKRSGVTTVQDYARDLKKRLESTLANYAKNSQKLDQTFPQRILLGSIEQMSINGIKTQLAQIENYRNKLKNIGILDDGASDTGPSYPLQSSQIDQLQATQLSVMSVYIKDMKEKLDVLSELSDRVEILLKTLNEKFTNKSVKISREQGLLILGIDEKPIPINALSSGEQHEIVLLYDLLFKVKPNTLVLIDEPELSLHITWQKNFMADLLKIIRISQFDVIMATHSPYIVGSRSDLLITLSKELDN